MKWYAEIDETGFCFHTTQTELPLSETILLADYDVIGMIWDGENWNEAPEEPSEPTADELMDILLGVTDDE